MQIQHLGRLAVHKVMEMESGLPLQMIFPEVTRADLARLASWYSDPSLATEPTDSSVVLSMHSFVVSLNGRNVLIDSCNGNCKQRSLETVHMLETPYLANLAEAGFTPEDIDMVMCTHLHFDHVGWNTRLEGGRWVPTFPNARYIFGKRDYEHWQAQEDIAPHREAFQDSVSPVVEAGLADIIDVERPTAAMHEVGDGIWLRPAFGHSPGCCTIHAKAGGEEAVFWGDVIHHPVQLIRPELTLLFDDDPLEAAKVRGALLERVVDNGTMCFPAHFRRSSAGRVRRDGDAYRFEFVDD